MYVQTEEPNRWYIDTSATNIPVDRVTRYNVTVRIWDNVGHESEEGTNQVWFDQTPPVVASFEGPSPHMPWHARAVNGASVNAIFKASVSDNFGVRKVSLNGTAPGGSDIGLFPLNPPPGIVACGKDPDPQLRQWQLNVRDHPLAAHHVGMNEFWIEAEDCFGNVRKSTPLVVEVIDTYPATVQNIWFDPGLAVEAGIPVQLYFEVEENVGLDDVKVYMARLSGPSSVYVNPDGTEATTRSQAVAVEAKLDTTYPHWPNGNGTYFIDIEEAFKTELPVGDHLFEIVARDVNADHPQHPTCKDQCMPWQAILRVVDKAAPILTQVAPATAENWLNASPTIQFWVAGTGIPMNGISVEAGRSPTDLQTVTTDVRFEERFSGGNSVGWNAFYSPDLANETQWSLRVHARDNTGLTNTTGIVTYKVDAQPPEIEVAVKGNRTGPDGLSYVVNGTFVWINASDEHSGVAEVLIQEQNGPWKIYTGPVRPAGADGDYVLSWRVLDKAGNRAEGKLETRLDLAGPIITVAQHGDHVRATVKDAGVGVDPETVMLHFAYGDDPYEATPLTPAGTDQFQIQLSGNASEDGLRYYFEARDRFGNLGTLFAAQTPHVIGKTPPPPTLAITSPMPGTIIGSNVEIGWVAVDTTGGPLSIVVARIDPEQGDMQIVTMDGISEGGYQYDATMLPPGEHTLSVTASSSSGTDRKVVTIMKADRVARAIAVPDRNATPMESVHFEIETVANHKPVQRVTFMISLDGMHTFEGEMEDVGSGVWRGAYAPTEGGAYSILIKIRYTDGTEEPPEVIAHFLMQDAPVEVKNGGMPWALILLMLLATVTIALGAYSALLRWPR